MNLRAILSLSLLLAAGLIPAPAAPQGPAPTPTLEIGDPAPPLTIDTWVKGEAVPALEKGKPYVVEFWATWCGPCRQSIPHLTELQARFKEQGLTVIGISASEKNGLADVKPFVERMGDKMDYRVAWDRNGATNRAYMTAAGQSGIPTAFVVDQRGRVAWIGHPVYPKGELDRVLEQVVAGAYDIEQVKANKARIKLIEGELAAAAQANDVPAVLAGLDQLLAIDASRYDQIAVKKLEILLFQQKDYAAGYRWAGELVDGPFREQPDMLNAIAWAIVDGPGLEQRDLDLAFRSATRANELTKGQEPQVLDTLARIHFERGEREKAVALQEEAVKLAIDGKTKKELQQRLDQYKAAGKD
jgi:thiol-disulfide isomerase/thioredoxin